MYLSMMMLAILAYVLGAILWYMTEPLNEEAPPVRKRATVADLTTPHIDFEEYEIPGVGWVLLRGMSRWEAVAVQKLENDKQAADTAAVKFGMVDPAMTEADVMAWRKAGKVMELENVARKINELSGIGKDAQKSDVSGDGK